MKALITAIGPEKAFKQALEQKKYELDAEETAAELGLRANEVAISAGNLATKSQ